MNILTPEFKANPFPFFASLRTSEPVYRTTLPDNTPVWLITRYQDVVELFEDERFVKNRRTAMTSEQLKKTPSMPPMFRPLERNMFDLDPPDHTRLRALVHKAFTPGMVGRVRKRLETLSHELLTDVACQREIDLINDYAVPLPMTIIGEILGVPATDRDKFHRWSKAVVSLSSPLVPVRVIPSVWMFIRYLRRLFERRRRHPQDDLASALIEAEEAGDKLSADELLGVVFLLLVAGQETTVNLIGNGMLTLLQHPHALTRLRNNPAMIKTAIEELLRFTSPVLMSTERYAREDSKIQRVFIPRGSMTLGVIGSANRDESVFENPDELDIAREPNKHLSFGQGIHSCLGAPLARLEAEIAIKTLLRRIPDLQLNVAVESLRWRPSMMLRGLESLPVSFGAMVD